MSKKSLKLIKYFWYLNLNKHCVETKANRVKKKKGKKGKKDLKQKIIDFAKSKFKFDMVTFLHKTIAAVVVFSFHSHFNRSLCAQRYIYLSPRLSITAQFSCFSSCTSCYVFQYTSGSLQIHTAFSAYVISVA